MQVRTYYENFRLAAARYFDAVLPYLADLQFTRGGPIVAVQVGVFAAPKRQTLLLSFLLRFPSLNGDYKASP